MIIDLRTPKEKEKEFNDFKRKMYPLGELQAKWEEEVLSKITSNKKDVPELRFLCVMRRQQLLDIDIDYSLEPYIPEELNTKEWLTAVKRMKISKLQEQLIDKIAFLENKATSLPELLAIEIKQVN